MTDQERQQIKELAAAHGGAIKAYRSPGGIAVFRKPTLEEYEAYFDEVSRGRGVVSPKRNLCISCLVFPDAKTWREMLAASPTLLLTASGGIEELAGAGVEELELPKE